MNSVFSDLNLTKLGQMLTTSSCVFVPVDDPEKDVLGKIAEVKNPGLSMTIYFYFLTQKNLIATVLNKL